MISSKEMVTCLVFDVCLMTIAMLTCGGLASDETCADLEFEGLTNGDTVRVKQYSYINVTFHLNTSKCPDSGDSFFLKVSAKEGVLSVGFCIIIIKNQDCSITPGSDCQCLSEPRGWVRMLRYLNVSGQMPIVWTWNNQRSSSRKDNAGIMFDVFSDFNTKKKTTVSQSDATSKTEGNNRLTHLFKCCTTP